MKNEIRRRVLEVISNMELDEVPDEETILKANYAEDEIFSSITFVLLIVLLEEEFGIEIDGENLLIENLATFDRIVELIEEML